MLSFLQSTSHPISFSLSRAFTKAAVDISKKIESIFDERIRPILQQDGGNVKLDKVENGVVHVTLTGHCSGCPSRRQTLHYGILGILQEEIPEIVDIKETI